jgi:hypothetical protein
MDSNQKPFASSLDRDGRQNGDSLMAASRYRAEYETALAVAWKAMQRAREAALLMNRDSVSDDCWQVAEEIWRLQEDSLKSGRVDRRRPLLKPLSGDTHSSGSRKPRSC